jgi:Integrase core domain.
VWTWQGLVTYYTVFVIDVASRRVVLAGSTPWPNELFMRQVVRSLVMHEGFLAAHRVLICDRDAKWSQDIREQLGDAGIDVVQTPARAPNANAHAERFVRSIKTECLARIVPLGERHFRRALAEYVAHYHGERNHQGLGNALIAGRPPMAAHGRVRRRPRLGGLLNYYERAA